MVSYFKPGVLAALFLTADQLFEICVNTVLFAIEGQHLLAAMQSHTVCRARRKRLKAKRAPSILCEISPSKML